jgi:hypothetical protein
LPGRILGLDAATPASLQEQDPINRPLDGSVEVAL